MRLTGFSTAGLWHGIWFVAGVAVGMLFVPRLVRVASRNAAAPGTNAAMMGAASPATPMPEERWGTVEALRIPLGAPDEYLGDRARRLQPPRWFFENISETELEDFFQSCPLSAEQRTQLLDRAHWQAASNGWCLLPPRALVRDLDSASRERIYGLLARSPANLSQRFPFRLRPGDFQSRFAASRLPADKLHFLRSLVYTNEDGLNFADLEILPDLFTADEVNRVLDAFYQVPAYRLRLRVHRDTDIDRLAKYWGTGGRERKIRPLLEALARLPANEDASISLPFLLPPFARLRLFTYPQAWAEPRLSREDCFWTSLNFFNEQPDARLMDTNYVGSVLKTDYELISDEPVFGDLVTLLDGPGRPFHMCVYIADDFVFTKNGTDTLAPWIFMKIEDMLLFYPPENGRRIVIFRRKGI